jgi:1-acyl-sn-glycerol-3-phosphate acyltransferase
MLYIVSRFVFLIILKLFFLLRIQGRDNLPARKPFIVCANHISLLDPLAVGAAIPAHYHIYYMAKKELFDNIILNRLLLMVGAFPVNRQEPDLNAVKRAYTILKEGNVLGLFPEGTRSKSGAIQKAFNGAALIAVRSGVPILPVAIEGPYCLFKPLKVHIGQPFTLPALVYEQKTEKKEQLEEMSCLIMNNISRMLPEQ